MSLRDRLRARSRPTRVFHLRVDDDTDAQQRLYEANLALRLAQAKHEPEHQDILEAEKRRQEAQAEVDECYAQLTLRALPPSDMEALLSGHPPTEEQVGRGEWVNSETMRPHLLAAVVEGDMTADDWREWCVDGSATLGEVRALTEEAMLVNDRSPVEHTGKG